MGAIGGGKADEYPAWHKAVGISLALGSAFLIGSSFVLKKRGLLDSNIADNKRPGQGHGYLKNGLWWTGLILMLVGELCNVAAYAFSPAILVTPLGAVSVVVSAIFSEIFLKEKLNFSAKIGCAQCILGAILLQHHNHHSEFLGKLALDPIFISYFIINCLGLAYLIFYAAPKWGERWPLIYISICSIIGSFVVVAMQGFGSAVVYNFANPSSNQFKEWSMYPLLLFVVLCGVMQINYLNKALNIFSTAIVTPVYYVFFTTATLLCSVILLRNFMFDSAISAVSAFVGFLVIIGGVALLFAYSLQLARSNDLNLQARTSSLSSTSPPVTGPNGTIQRTSTLTRHTSSDSAEVNMDPNLTAGELPAVARTPKPISVGPTASLSATTLGHEHAFSSAASYPMMLVPNSPSVADAYDFYASTQQSNRDSRQNAPTDDDYFNSRISIDDEERGPVTFGSLPGGANYSSSSSRPSKARRPESTASLTIDSPPGGFTSLISPRAVSNPALQMQPSLSFGEAAVDVPVDFVLPRSGGEVPLGGGGGVGDEAM
ncbi:magnesium transporter NIPA-domain-containing protein [Chytridium lagenaria]|nr:magnesium transporter NIPA-domain-containing protein [Chytridium lagenaria]